MRTAAASACCRRSSATSVWTRVSKATGSVHSYTTTRNARSCTTFPQNLWQQWGFRAVDTRKQHCVCPGPTTTEKFHRVNGVACRRYSISPVSMVHEGSTTTALQDDERHQARVSLTKKLLREDNFEEWEDIIHAQSGTSSLNVLLHEWDECVQKPLQVPIADLELFSDLCLRVTQKSSVPTFQWRALLLALTMWSRLALDSTSNNNKSAVETMFQHARRLFDAAPPLCTSFLSARDIRWRQILYRHAFPVFSRSDHIASSQHCYEILQQVIAEEAMLADSTVPSKDLSSLEERLLSPQHFERTLETLAKNGEETLFGKVKNQMNELGWSDSAATYGNLIFLLYTMHGQMTRADMQPTRDFPGEALQHWQRLLALYSLDPSQIGEPGWKSLIRLLHMHKDDPDKSLEILVNTFVFIGEYPTYQSLINGLITRRALRTFKEHREPQKAERLWNFMMGEFNRGNTDLKPVPEHFSLLIQVHVEAQDFDKARKYLDQMEESECESAWSYNVYLKGLLDHRYNMSEMMEIFERMSKNPRPNTSPSLEVYETMMHATMKSRGPNSVRKVHELYESAVNSLGKDQKMRSSIYTIAMSAWTRSLLPEALDRCREIWNHIESPELFHYNLMLRAFTHAGHLGEADALLWEMLMGDEVSPNVMSFATVIGAYSDRWDDKRSMELFEIMIRTAKQKGSIDSDVWPDPYTIGKILRGNPKTVVPNAIRIWTLVENSGMEIEADLLAVIVKILGECDDVDGAYGYILYFVGRLNRTFPHSEKVVWHAVHAYAELAGRRNPRSTTSHMQDDQISALFDECCKTGQLSGGTLDAFRSYMRPALYRRLTLQNPRSKANSELVPEDWRRNVRYAAVDSN